MSNLRPFPLRHPGISKDAEKWLAAQPDTVRRVTFIKDGEVFQRPHVDAGAFVDPTAQLIGGVYVSAGCFIGPYAVVRLDEKPGPAPLIIGRDSNLQDFALIHADTIRIGDRVIVAHQAVVHGAEVDDDVTIYIQAVVDGGGTIVGRGAFLHQGCYVGKGIHIAPGRYVEPGQRVLTQAEADSLVEVPEALKAIRAKVLEHNRLHREVHNRLSF
jgi:carbonic anhydrase/acetyltransferase-like protein (isoleucine patch superfamily)